MLVFRLMHLKDIPDYQTVLNLIKENDHSDSEITESKDIQTKKYLNFEKGTVKKSTEQIKNMTQTKTDLPPIKSFLTNEEEKITVKKGTSCAVSLCCSYFP